jgi:tetratricopeptide (TPR) repeat protein
MPEITINALPPRLQRQVELARTAIDRGNAEYAITLCEQLLAAHPGCLAVRRMLRAAQVKVFMGRNRIVAWLLGTLGAAPSIVGARTALAKSPLLAMTRAEKALNACPICVAALDVLAEAAVRLDLPETAVFALEAVCEKSPHNLQARIRLADACIAAGREPGAMALAEMLLREHPSNGEVQALVKRASVAQSITAGRWESGSGTFRDKLRDEQQAVSLEQSSKVVTADEATRRLLDEALARLEAEPESLNHFRTVINACRTLGRIDEAIAHLTRARALPLGAADMGLERLASELELERIDGRIRARVAEVAAAGGDAKTDADVVHLRAELAARRLADARALAEKYPNDPGLKFDLGRLFLEAGEIEPAIQQFQAAQRSPKHRIAALRHLGECFQSKGLLDLALQQFQTAKDEIAAFDEEKKEVIYRLGGCLEAMGKTEEALDHYKLIYSVDIGFRDVSAKIDSFYSKRST